MRENFIKEKVILVERILFQYIHQTSHIQFILLKNGGVMFGIHYIIERTLILIEVFLSNLKNYIKEFHYLVYGMLIMKIQNIIITVIA
jgi:hypothetical protein